MVLRTGHRSRQGVQHVVVTEPKVNNCGPRTAEAMEWLRAVLQHGPQYTNDIMDVADEDGISRATLRLAKTALSVEARKDRGVGGGWVWVMPNPVRPIPVDEETIDEVFLKEAIEKMTDVLCNGRDAQGHTDVDEETDDDESGPTPATIAFDDRLLRASDIAEFLSVSKSRAHELMANGTFPAFRIGRSIRVSKRSLEQWVHDNERGGGA